MKSLIKLELLRAKNVYNKQLIFFLSIALLLILGLFFFVLKTGGFYTNTFYTYYTDNPQIKALMEQNQKFLFADIHSDLYFLIGQRINLIPSGFSGYAASASAYTFFQDYNRFVWQQEHVPPFVYLSLQERNQTKKQKEASFPQQRNSSQQRVLNNPLQNALQKQSKNQVLSREETTASQGDASQNTAKEQSFLQDTSSATLSSPLSSTFPEVHQGFHQQKQSIQQRLQEEIKKTTKTYHDLLTTEDLEPRMPFDQIYVSLSFIVLLTFLALMFTNRIMDEKINKKGMLLFVAPLKRHEIIFGKLLPYAAAAFFLSLLILLPFRPTFSGFFAFSLIILSIIAAYLAISFFIGVVARSFKELSFLGIFGISLYSLFLLIPVFLLHFSEASYASPLTPLVKVLLHESVSFSLLLFSALPHLLFALVLFYVGYYLLHPEEFFSVKPLWKKILAIYEHSLLTPWQSIVAGFTGVFFVYFLELLAIVVFITMQKQYLLPFILGTSAFIEEMIRNLPLLVILEKHLIWKERLFHGALVAFGFFLAEKFLLLISIAPFTTTLSLLQFSTLFFPLLMHIFLSFLFMIVFSLLKSFRYRFWFAIIFTSLIHFAINYYLFQFLH